MNQAVFLNPVLVSTFLFLSRNLAVTEITTATLDFALVHCPVVFLFCFLMDWLSSSAGEVPSVLASGALSQVPVLRGGSYGRVQHAPVHSQRVQSHRCQGALDLLYIHM